MKFCTLCFTTDTDGSHNHVVFGDFCTNCSANGAVVELPEWAIKNIREQASWVGKRFYPCAEDREQLEERTDLLALVEQFPGRTAKLVTVDDRDTWEVQQRLANGHTVSTWVPGAATGQQAMRQARSLRFMPQWRLDEAKEKKS